MTIPKLEKAVELFFIGIMISFLVSLLEIFELEQLPIDSLEYVIYSITFVGPFVRLLYYSLLVIIIPFMAIHQLRNKLGKKGNYVYKFLTGITFGFSFIGLYTILTKLIFL